MLDPASNLPSNFLKHYYIHLFFIYIICNDLFERSKNVSLSNEKYNLESIHNDNN